MRWNGPDLGGARSLALSKGLILRENGDQAVLDCKVHIFTKKEKKKALLRCASLERPLGCSEPHPFPRLLKDDDGRYLRVFP